MEETEATSSNSDDDTKPAVVCRLRHGLNENCLLYVFEYLDEMDLLRLCEMDPYYKELILKWTIKNKCLNLKSPNDNLQLFETFGESMRKLRIVSSKFVVTFGTLMKYCKPGQLTEVDIDITERNGVLGRADMTDALCKLTLMTMPIFSNLHKLRFHLFGVNADPVVDPVVDVYTNFLTQISTAAVNLRTLDIDQLQIRGDWLQNMRNLEELRIVWKMGSSLDSLVNYFNAKPNLKIFKFLHHGADVTSISSIFKALAESCPKLETFFDSDRNLSSMYTRFDDSLTKRYASFSKFSYLNFVTLTTYTFCGSDLYYPLVNLATKNLANLRIMTCASQPIVLEKEVKAEIKRRPLPQFVRIKSVELFISPLNVPDLFDPNWTRCDLRSEFLKYFLHHANAEGLQHLAISGFDVSKIDKLLAFLPTVRVLNISGAHLHDTFREVSNIVKTVLTSPGRSARKGAFQLVLRDDEKVQYFKQQNDLKDVINFTFITSDNNRRYRNKWDL